MTKGTYGPGRCQWCGAQLEGRRRRWCRKSHAVRHRERALGLRRGLADRVELIIRRAAEGKRLRAQLEARAIHGVQGPAAGSSSSGGSTPSGIRHPDAGRGRAGGGTTPVV